MIVEAWLEEEASVSVWRYRQLSRSRMLPGVTFQLFVMARWINFIYATVALPLCAA
jgi:hypothetical protein